MSKTKLIVTTSAILLMAAALAADRKPRGATEVTSASVAALNANLGSPEGLAIDEVRVTDDGVACVEYRLRNDGDGDSGGHAVVQDDDVLKSSTDAERFDDAWNEHCLEPRGSESRAP